MRWIPSEYKYKFGDLRQRQKFLWFPKTLNGETRWLETAQIEYEWCYGRSFGLLEYGWEAVNWVPRPAAVTAETVLDNSDNSADNN